MIYRITPSRLVQGEGLEPPSGRLSSDSSTAELPLAMLGRQHEVTEPSIASRRDRLGIWEGIEPPGMHPSAYSSHAVQSCTWLLVPKATVM